MPCYTYEEPEDIVNRARAEFTHNSPVAQNLCTIMKLIEQHGCNFRVPNDVQRWWEEHKRRDARKKRRELEQTKRDLEYAEKTVRDAQRELARVKNKWAGARTGNGSQERKRVRARTEARDRTGK